MPTEERRYRPPTIRDHAIDLATEESFDRLVRLVAGYFHVPLALVYLAGAERTWSEARDGFDRTWVDRSVSLCHKVAASGEPLVIEDARRDARYATTPLVTEAPGILFYASVPLVTDAGERLGALCLFDTEPRTFGEAEAACLADFAALAIDQIERGRAERKALRIGEEVRRSKAETEAILNSISDAFFSLDTEWRFSYINKNAEPLLGRSRDELIGRQVWELYADAVGTTFYQEYHRAVRDQVSVQFVEYYAPFQRWFEVRAYPFEQGLSVYFTDVTERVVEQRFQEAEAEILEMVASGRSLDDVLEALILAVELRSTGFRGSVLLRSADGRHLVCGAAPSLPEAYNQAIDGLEIGPRAGSCGTAAFTRKPVIASDIATDPRWADFRIALDFGLHASWSQPIIGSDGEVLGTFALYYGEPREPSPADLAIIESAGHLAGIAIERTRQQQELREREERFRSLVKATSAIVWTTSADGSFVSEQPEWAAFTGQSRPTYLGTGWLEAVHPDDRDRTARGWHEALGRQQLYEMEHRLRRHDGAYRHMLVRAVPVKDEAGTVREWVGINTDITEKKEAEEALRQSEERHRALFEQAIVGIAQTDMNGQLVMVNDRFCRLLGRSREELLQLTVQDITHPDDAAENESLFRRLITDGGSYTIEKRYVRSDGSVVWANNTVSLVRTPGGEPMYPVAIVQDISDRKRAEELQRSNRELEQFAYIASHDLQEPLRKINSFGDLLTAEYGGDLPEEAQSYLERMRDATQRMQRLIQDLLSFSRVTTQPTPFQPVDLGGIVSEVLSDLEVPIESSGARVDVEALPTVQADPMQMRQLFQNLIGNALKFRRDDVAPIVKVYAEPPASSDAPDGPGRVHRIYVEDNGIGFDEKYLDKVFAPFQRLHRQQQYSGTGIGLAICKKIAERHGGDITARSRPGEGATFIVTLSADASGPA